MRLTVSEIAYYITNDVVLAAWPWEHAIESAMGEGWEAAVSAALFLEKLTPGKAWRADEFYGLIYNHFTGRWDSAVEIGMIRARESYEDAKERYAANPAALANCKRRFEERTASVETAEKYIRNLQSQGTHVFDCLNGGVITFDKLFGGVIDEEDPA